MATGDAVRKSLERDIDRAIDRIDAWFSGLFALSALYAAIAALIGAVGAITSMLQT